jgi:hypothetical protein
MTRCTLRLLSSHLSIFCDLIFRKFEHIFGNWHPIWAAGFKGSNSVNATTRWYEALANTWGRSGGEIYITIAYIKPLLQSGDNNANPSWVSQALHVNGIWCFHSERRWHNMVIWLRALTAGRPVSSLAPSFGLVSYIGALASHRHRQLGRKNGRELRVLYWCELILVWSVEVIWPYSLLQDTCISAQLNKSWQDSQLYIYRLVAGGLWTSI